MDEKEEPKAGCETDVRSGEVVDLDRARAVASIVRAIQADPEAMRIINELRLWQRSCGISREQFAEQFDQAWKELEQEKDPAHG